MSRIINFQKEYDTVLPDDYLKIGEDDGTEDKAIKFSDLVYETVKKVQSNRVLKNMGLNSNGDLQLESVDNTGYKPSLFDKLTFDFILENIPYDYQYKKNIRIYINDPENTTPIPLWNGIGADCYGYTGIDRNTIGNGAYRIIYAIELKVFKLYKLGTPSLSYYEDPENLDENVAGFIKINPTLSTQTESDYPLLNAFFGTTQITLNNKVLTATTQNSSTPYHTSQKGVVALNITTSDLGSFNSNTYYSNIEDIENNFYREADNCGSGCFTTKIGDTLTNSYIINHDSSASLCFPTCKFTLNTTSTTPITIPSTVKTVSGYTLTKRYGVCYRFCL